MKHLPRRVLQRVKRVTARIEARPAPVDMPFVDQRLADGRDGPTIAERVSGEVVGGVGHF